MHIVLFYSCQWYRLLCLRAAFDQNTTTFQTNLGFPKLIFLLALFIASETLPQVVEQCNSVLAPKTIHLFGANPTTALKTILTLSCLILQRVIRRWCFPQCTCWPNR